MKDDEDPFEDIFEQMNEMIEEMMSQGGFPGMQPGSSDFSFGGTRFTQGPDGEADFQSFGDWPGAGDVSGDSFTHVDVMEEDDEIHVVADLPGVDKEDIDLKVKADHLKIEASNEERSYEEVVKLPADVDEDSASASYNNGVLEVSFTRLEDETSKHIDIE